MYLAGCLPYKKERHAEKPDHLSRLPRSARAFTQSEEEPDPDN
jgi:hypothetical protein